jgi:hypothetical protein
MTREVCDIITERVALGEPLAEHEAHARDCARCKRLVALPVEIGAAEPADPGAGFSARIIVGAQRRLVARKRARVGVGAVAAAATVAFGVFAVTREPDRAEPPPPSIKQPAAEQMQVPPPSSEHGDADVRELVKLADVDRSSHVSAHWARIEKPLAPYRALVKGVTP